MKKWWVALAVFAVSVVACGVPQADYDQAVAERNALEEQVQTERQDRAAEIEALEQAHETIHEQFMQRIAELEQSQLDPDVAVLVHIEQLLHDLYRYGAQEPPLQFGTELSSDNTIIKQIEAATDSLADREVAEGVLSVLAGAEVSPDGNLIDFESWLFLWTYVLRNLGVAVTQ